MKLTCPACGATASLDVLIGHEGARDAVMVSLSLPAPLGSLLVQYLALFRPKARNLSFDRVANLLQSLKPMVRDARIERNGRIWSAPQEYWVMGLTEMIAKRDSLTLPLKSHGYLLTIIEGYSNKAESKHETQTEARRGGHTPVGGTVTAAHTIVKQEASKPRTMMPDHVKQALKPTPTTKEI